MKKTVLSLAVIAAAACALCAQTPAPAAEKPAAASVKVEKIVIAAGVENREPVGESSAFAAGTERVYIWTKVSAAQVPTKIKHVFYLDDKPAGEITLAVSSSPYRVWSWKTARPGNWKVDVTDEAGSVLSSAVFTVAKPAAAPAAK